MDKCKLSWIGNLIGSTTFRNITWINKYLFDIIARTQR